MAANHSQSSNAPPSAIARQTTQPSPLSAGNNGQDPVSASPTPSAMMGLKLNMSLPSVPDEDNTDTNGGGTGTKAGEDSAEPEPEPPADFSEYAYWRKSLSERRILDLVETDIRVKKQIGTLRMKCWDESWKDITLKKQNLLQKEKDLKVDYLPFLDWHLSLMFDECALMEGALDSHLTADRATLGSGQNKRKRDCSDLSMYPNVKQSLIKKYHPMHLYMVRDEFNGDSLLAMEGKWVDYNDKLKSWHDKNTSLTKDKTDLYNQQAKMIFDENQVIYPAIKASIENSDQLAATIENSDQLAAI